MNTLLNILVLLASIIFYGCSDVIDEDEATITSALIALTDGNCSEAISILESMSDVTTNARWHQTYASAQACFTSFTEITFFDSDVDLIDSTSLTTLGRSLPQFSTSDDMTTATDTDYVQLYGGVTTLISAGGVSTNTFASRAAVFDDDDNQNITLQALYFSIANLGQYFRFFGNADATGTKGSGGSGNGCYMDYTDGAAAAAIGGASTGSCAGAGDAHPDMTDALACNGVVLLNTVFNTLQNIDIPDDSGDLSEVDDTISALITACQGALGGSNAICTMVDQDLCEAEGNAIIQRYFALVVEQIHL